MADINRCTASALAKNAKIPADIARDIVKYRKRDAKIRDLKELWGLPGMTREVFRKISNSCFINSAVLKATNNVPSMCVTPCLGTSQLSSNQYNASDYHILSPVSVHPSPSGRKLTAIYHRYPVSTGPTVTINEQQTNSTLTQQSNLSTKAIPPSSCRSPLVQDEPGHTVRNAKQKVSPTRNAIGDRVRRSLQDPRESCNKRDIIENWLKSLPEVDTTADVRQERSAPGRLDRDRENDSSSADSNYRLLYISKSDKMQVSGKLANLNCRKSPQEIIQRKSLIDDEAHAEDTFTNEDCRDPPSRGRSLYRRIRLNNSGATDKSMTTRLRSPKSSGERSSNRLSQCVRMITKPMHKQKRQGKNKTSGKKPPPSRKKNAIKKTPRNTTPARSPHNSNSRQKSDSARSGSPNSPQSKRKRSVHTTDVRTTSTSRTGDTVHRKIVVVASVHAPPTGEKGKNRPADKADSTEARSHVCKEYHREEEILVEHPDGTRRSVMKSSKSKSVRRSLWSDKIEQVYTKHQISRLAKKKQRRRHYRSGRHDREIVVPHRLPICVLI